MQVSTSTDWPRTLGSGRRTTRRNVSRASPLGRVRISAGAALQLETRLRRATAVAIADVLGTTANRPTARSAPMSRQTLMPAAPANTASINVRLSKEAREENLSKEGMVADCHALAERMGLTVVAVHIDDGI